MQTPDDLFGQTSLPATEKQLAYARALSAKAGVPIAPEAMADRKSLSRWINTHQVAASRFSAYPSSKQVAFAERIARLKRREIPAECFRDKTLMSRWIDGNKP